MEGKEVITLKQVLATMAATAEPFSLRFVKYNEAKGTGGEVVEVSGMLQSSRGQSTPPAAGAQPAAEQEPGTGSVRRTPNHFDNGTRNLLSTLNGNFCKVHIWFITEFNGKKVLI